MQFRFDPAGMESELGRLAAYQYLGELVADRRVLEVGCGRGLGVELLLARGARRVVGLGEDLRAAQAALDGAPEDRVALRPLRGARLPLLPGETFDLVVVSDARLAVSRPGILDEVARALAPEGLVAVWAPSGDHPAARGGVPYGDLLDLLEPRFARVRVVGQSPFCAYGMVELTGAGELPELSVDATLLGGHTEEVVAYLALATGAPAPALDLEFGIVQVPSGGLSVLPPLLSEPEPEAEAQVEPEPRPGAAPGTDSAAPAPDAGDLADHAGGLLTRWRWPSIFR